MRTNNESWAQFVRLRSFKLMLQHGRMDETSKPVKENNCNSFLKYGDEIYRMRLGDFKANHIKCTKFKQMQRITKKMYSKRPRSS